MYVFELRVVHSKNLDTEEKSDGEKIKVREPFIVCQKCNFKNPLHEDDISTFINEFEFASLLRVLKIRHRELHDKLNNYYDKVSNTLDQISEVNYGR